MNLLLSARCFERLVSSTISLRFLFTSVPNGRKESAVSYGTQQSRILQDHVDWIHCRILYGIPGTPIVRISAEIEPWYRRDNICYCRKLVITNILRL